MRIVQLGCGITGLVCAEQLVKNPEVSEVVLADSRTDAAERAANRIRSEKVSIAKVNGTDVKDLRRLMRGTDIIVSSMPWELNRRVLNTAASVGTNYVDFSLTVDSIEDFETAIKMCADSEITALTAMGEDPGISDAFARYAANKLDRAEEAHVMDGDSGSVEGLDFFSLWSPMDLLEETTVPAAVFRNGEMTFVPPLDVREVYEFPPPIGPLPVYKTNHEETYLMPRYIEGLRNADFRIAIDDNFASVVRMLRKLGLHGLEPIDVKGVKVRPLDVVVALMPRPVDLAGKVKGHACVVVEVIGVKNGNRTRVKVWTMMSHERAYELCGSNATGYLVGIGGAVPIEMMIDGEIKEKGLLVAEQLPSERFVARLRAKGLQVNEQITQL